MSVIILAVIGVYLIGSIVSYILCGTLDKILCDDDNKQGHIYVMFSWLAVVIGVIVFICFIKEWHKWLVKDSPK